MSLTEINNNTTFDYLPSEIKVNKSNIFQNNANASTVSHSRKSPIVYNSGVDDYVFNEIKKAKYQGCFDPGSLGNKNIFNDNHNHRINTEESSKTALKKTFDKNKKFSNYANKHTLRHDEGKNLLIEKSEIQYPLKFDKYSYMLYNTINNCQHSRYNKSIDYNYNSSPITIKRNYLKNKNNKSKTDIYNYYTPANEDRKKKKEMDKYQNRVLIKKSLMNNYNENSRMISKRLNNKKSQYSIDITDGSNLLSYNRDNFFSPIVYASRNSVYEASNNKKNNKNRQLNPINVNDLKCDDNILRHSNNVLSNDINDINITNEEEYDMDFNNVEKENVEQKEIVVDKDYEDIKLIKMYRNKLLSLFFMHMGNFYILHFKNIFNDFLSGLKSTIKNKKYHFENKTIINIPEIKKNLISNSYYYGHNKQYTTLLRDIKNKKNLQKLDINNNKKNNNKYIISNNNKNNNYNNNNNKNNLQINYQKIEKNSEKMKNLIKKRYILNNKQIMKKSPITNNELKSPANKNMDISNKKYIKKNISKGIFTKKKPEIKTAKKEIVVKDINFNKNIIQAKRKIIKSFDRNTTINNGKKINNIKNKKIVTSSNASTITVKKNNEAKSKPFKKPIPNLNNIKNKVFNINKTKEKNNDNNNLLDIIIKEKNNLLNEQNNSIQIHDITKGKIFDDKVNMTFKYIEINSNNISPRDKNENNKSLKIESVLTHTFCGNEINKQNLKENEIDSVANNNLQNALSIITKIIENKEKDDEIKNIRNSLLSKIINNKISKENKQNKEIIKKYFDLMKIKNNQIEEQPSKYKSKKKKKYSADLGEISKFDKANDDLIIEKKMFKSDNEEIDKNQKNENNEENISSSRSKGKFRVVIKKVRIHKRINKIISDSNVRKIKGIKSAKNILPLIADINDIESRNIIKKTISLSILRKNKSLTKRNINKNKIKEIIENKDNNKEVKQNINVIKVDNKEEIQNNNENKKEEKQELINFEKKDEQTFEKEEKDKYNLSIDDNFKINDIPTNSEKHLYRSYKLVKNTNKLNEEKRKSLVNIPRFRKNIESFNKYRKSKSKLNKSKNESINEGDSTIYEKYQDCENLIYYLRIQLIYCFIKNSKNNESFND